MRQYHSTPKGPQTENQNPLVKTGLTLPQCPRHFHQTGSVPCIHTATASGTHSNPSILSRNHYTPVLLAIPRPSQTRSRSTPEYNNPPTTFRPHHTPPMGYYQLGIRYNKCKARRAQPLPLNGAPTLSIRIYN